MPQRALSVPAGALVDLPPISCALFARVLCFLITGNLGTFLFWLKVFFLPLSDVLGLMSGFPAWLEQPALLAKGLKAPEKTVVSHIVSL